MMLNLPVIILNGIYLIPSSEIKLEFNDEISKNIIDESEIFHDKKILIVTKINNSNDLIKDLPKIGVIAKIVRKLELPNGNIRIVLEGIRRVEVIEYLNIDDNNVECIVKEIKEDLIEENVKEVIKNKLYNGIKIYIEKFKELDNNILNNIKEKDNISEIIDIIASNLNLEMDEKQKYLNELDSIKRAEYILEYIYKKEQLFDIEENINSRIKKDLDEEQRKIYIKEKIKYLQEELGETSLKDNEIKTLKEKLDNLNVEESIKSKIQYEIDRYENMSNLSPEINMQKRYIDFMLELPWNKYTKDNENIDEVKKVLDETHYGLDEVKQRIIENIILNEERKENSTIICLVGPPGVGKTTIAQTIAKSLNRKFTKISLGGVSDSAFIKGHTRTYMGSLPGKIIDGIKRSGSSNPVFLIDEVDKLDEHKSDIENALLEVLDQVQNKHFKDNYLEEEYDLSKVLFILTANDISNMSRILKDRLEIINIEGYTEKEKIEIAKKYMIPKICNECNIDNIKISDKNILNIIRYYTQELGLRELYRMIFKIVRKVLLKKKLNNKISLAINTLDEYLGNKIYEKELLDSEVGLTCALAYTECGGDIVHIESNYYEGSGNLICTGTLGNMMLESSKIALSYIKSNYKKFNIDYKKFKNDIHINVPNIDIKKEGPSAGIAITTSLISTLSNIKIPNNIAMTGEITLLGNVLKVGGIKEKIMGAYKNNIEIVFIPYYNINDLDEIPKYIKEKIKIIPVKKYDEIYEFIKGV